MTEQQELIFSANIELIYAEIARNKERIATIESNNLAHVVEIRELHKRITTLELRLAAILETVKYLAEP